MDITVQILIILLALCLVYAAFKRGHRIHKKISLDDTISGQAEIKERIKNNIAVHSGLILSSMFLGSQTLYLLMLIMLILIYTHIFRKLV